MATSFQTTPFVNPYAPSIAEILAHSGDAQARASALTGQAYAHAAEANGAVWGHAVESAAQIPSQMMQQSRTNADDAQLRALRQSEIEDRNQQTQARARDLAGQQAGTTAIKSAVDPETGQVDHEKAASLWEQAGFPTQANAYRESTQKTKQTALAITEAQQKIDAGTQQKQQALIDHMGELAAVGLNKLKTQTPQEARDTTMGIVASAIAHGTINPDDGQKFLMQTAGATPDQLQGIYQQALDQSPNVKERLLKDALTTAETNKNNAEATKALQPPKGSPTEEDDQRYRGIQAAMVQQQPVSPADAAWAHGYEKQKTLGVDATAGAASDRLSRTIDQQNKINQGNHDFDVVKTARADIQKNADTPYQTAAASAQELRDLVTAAKGGNKVAGSLQSLQTAATVIRANGLNRINMAEISMPAGAGSAIDRLNGFIGKYKDGEPVPADIQKDMLQVADVMERGAYKKYATAHAGVNKLYGTTIDPTFEPPSSVAPPASTGGATGGLTYADYLASKKK